MPEHYCTVTLTVKQMRTLAGRASLYADRARETNSPLIAARWDEIAGRLTSALAHPHVQSRMVAVDLPRVPVDEPIPFAVVDQPGPAQ